MSKLDVLFIIGVHVISALGFLLSSVLGAWLLRSVVRSGRS